MTDQFELQLRDAFRRAELPLRPDRLRQVLIELPASRRSTDRSRVRDVGARTLRQDGLRLAAVLALFAVMSGAVLYGIANWRSDIGPSQSPSPSPTTHASPTSTASNTSAPLFGPLPAPAAMLSEHPDADIAFQRTVGPPDQPLSDDTTLDEINLGPLEFARDIVLGAACIGPGELTVDIRYPNVSGASDPFVGLVSPCNGKVVEIGYQGSEAGDLVELQVIAIRVPRGASWRFVIGEVQGPVVAPGTFAPIAGTEGWWRLWDVQQDAVDPSTGMGVGVRVADDVTRLAIFVECAAVDSMTLEATHDSPSLADNLSMPVTCAGGRPERHELAVAAGEEITIKILTDSPAPARLFVEANAMPVSEWGQPPALSSELAAAPFIASSGSQIALGSLGATRQTLVAVPGVGPLNRPGGDYVAIPNAFLTGPLLQLYSVSSGEQIATLAEHEPGTFIATTWVDAAHGQVFYTLASATRLQVDVYRVDLDGSGQTKLATVSSAAFSNAVLALDTESFVVTSCQSRSCEATVIDTASLEIRSSEYELDAEVCDSPGATDGVVVLRLSDSSTTTPPQEVLVVDYEGNELLRVPDPGFVDLVRTTDAPVLLIRGLSDDAWQVVRIANGSSTPLDVDAALLMPVSGVALPPDWVLLAPFSGIGDFPIHPSLLLGEPPLLVNIVTGETIEMLNLPH